VFVDFGCAFGVNHYADRVGYADGVAELYFAGVGQAGGHDILGDITGHIAGGAVNLGWVFAAEGPAAVSAASAVGIDDNFASRQAAVAFGAADLEPAGGVNMEDDFLIHKFFRQDGHNDLLNDFPSCFVGHPVGSLVNGGGVVLCAANHRMNAKRFAVVAVFDGDLTFAVRTKPFDFA